MPEHKWLWLNTTQVGFGKGVVKEHLSKFVKPGAKVICTFGGGSIDKNGARADTQAALDALGCKVQWEGGIPPNPEYDRLVEIIAVVKKEKPDLLLAVGGGSVLDATKFISVAAKLPDGVDAWEEIMIKKKYPVEKFNVGSVMTLPATGSEWNSNFVISRRSISAKIGGGNTNTFPVFSLLDPVYTMSLPPRQLANGVYDALTHCMDQYLTGAPFSDNPMMFNFWLAVMKELVEIGPDVVKPGSSLELHERLIVAASFALNFAFALGVEGCWAIHMLGHQLTAEYDIDHGATLAIVGPALLQNQFAVRKDLLAKSAEYVFGVKTGTVEQKAQAFIDNLKKFIVAVGCPLKVSDWKGVTIKKGDAAKITQMVWESMGGKPFGWHKTITKEVTQAILEQVVV